MKRFLSIILTIAMLISMLPLSVFAEEIELFASENLTKEAAIEYIDSCSRISSALKTKYKKLLNGETYIGNLTTINSTYYNDYSPYINKVKIYGSKNGGAWTCNGFGKYVYAYLFGISLLSPYDEFSNICLSKSSAKPSYTLFKNKGVKSGTHIRTGPSGSDGHTMIVLDYTEDYLYVYHGNYGSGKVRVTKFSWDSFYQNEFVNKGRKFNYVATPKDSYYGECASSQALDKETPSISQGTTSNTNTTTTTKLDKNVYINLTNYPTNGFVPKSFPLKGTIKSDYPIYYITGIIKNLDTGEEICHWDNPGKINSKKYNIQGSSLDKAMKFNNIRYSGNYRLRIVATNSLGKSSTIDKDFTVIGQNQYTSQQPSISISNIEEGQKAVISCSDSNAIIHYTVNGGREKTGYSFLSQEFTSAGYYNITAWTTRSGYNDSAVTNKTVSVSKVSTPKIGDVKYGTNNAFVTVSGNGSINYTTNGNTPTKNSTAYTGPIYLDKTSTVKAIASRYGEENSSIAQKRISISAPDKPSIYLYNTKTKIAQGKTATVRWEKTDRATSYIASLYYDGEWVNDYETTGTTAAFRLPEVGVYTIKVKAHNFKGDSGESNAITVESMAPVTITFVDKIVRENEVTDDVVSQIQQNINDHDGENAGLIEGNVVAIQKIDYDSKPTSPEPPSKKGFTFAEYGEGRYDAATEDKTIDVLYKVNYYNVEFYDTSTDTPSMLGDTQRIMYTMSAEEPTNYTAPDGYIFSGWNVDNSQSTGFDYTFVDGNMKLYTAYSWHNVDLPVYIQFNSIERDDASYTANLSFKTPQELQNGTDDIVFRLVVALYTSEGKNVYTQVRDEDIKLGTQNNWTVNLEAVDLAYSGKASYASAYAVAVENGKTGGAMSPMATCDKITYVYDENVVSQYWTDWSEWVTKEELDALGITDDDYTILESKNQYRYRDARITTSTTSSTKSGWTRYDTDSSTGSWKSNGTSYVSSENSDYRTREVRSTYHDTTYKTQYRYGRWTNGSNSTFCPDFGYMNYGGSWWKTYTSWSDSQNYYWNYNYDAGRPYHSYCGYSGHTHVNVSEWINGVPYWNQRYVNGYSGKWFWEETRSVVDVAAHYTYEYRDTYYTYYFYKYYDEDWSSWRDSSISSKTRREIQNRTVYRYRTASGSDVESEDLSAYTAYDKTGVLENVTENLEGELATVMIYKKTNTDPTEEQIEYINQITIGAGNTYEIHAKTKEKIDYALTGDFIVTLALEGSKRLFNIDYIKAPVPQYKVDFYCNGELHASKLVDEGSGVDVNEVGIPETPEGQKFVKWDQSVVNVTSDLSVNAVTEAEICSIVFVDHENETAEIQEILYGEPIPAPEVEEVAGKVFKGWKTEDEESDEEINTVLETDDSVEEIAVIDETEATTSSEQTTELIATKSMVITAQWETLEYTVAFYDFEGNVVSEQKVKHGEAAQIPDFVVKDGVAYSWDLTGSEWWNVTGDMSITPYIPQTVQVDAPTISTPIEDNYGMFMAELESNVEGGKIYYVLDEAITEADAKTYVDNIASTGEQLEIPETEEIALFDTTEEASEEYYPDAIDFITEYTEPIELYAGSVVYAFAVDTDGNISPISVFQYEYDLDAEDAGIVPNEYEPASDTPQITMPTITATPGEIVTIPVTIKNNPGLTNLSLILGYDTENLILEDVSNSEVFDDNEFDYETREDGNCKFTWESSSGNDTDGELMSLTFTVADTAVQDDYLIDLSVDYSAIDEEETYLVTVPGTITQSIGLLGDVNGDEEVDFSDAILILKFDAGMINTLTN